MVEALLQTTAEEVPFQPSALLYWYRPRLASDPTGLQWTAAFDTYDTTTHEKGSELSYFDFQSAGITNPALARALIGLSQINMMTYTTLGQKLDAAREQTSAPDSLIDVLCGLDGDKEEMKKNGVFKKDLYFGPLLDDVGFLPGRNILEMVDGLCQTADPWKAVKAIDAFVAFYNGSRAIVLSRVEHAVRPFLLQNNTKYPLAVPDYIPIVDKLVGTFSDSPEERRRLQESDKGFQRIISLLSTFLASAADVSEVTLGKGVTVDNTQGTSSIQFLPEYIEKLWGRYKRELRDGFSNLSNPSIAQDRPYYGPNEREVLRTPLLGHIKRALRSLNGDKFEAGISDSNEYMGVKKPGECPFFETGYRREK